jgi:hypothetical protein
MDLGVNIPLYGVIQKFTNFDYKLKKKIRQSHQSLKTLAIKKIF